MEVPHDYPYGCDDKRISSILREYANEIVASDGNVNKVLQLAPLIVIGQAELQGRQTSRISRISVGLGVLSIVIAVVALWVSIANSRTDASWRTSQSEVLKTIHHDLQTCYELQTRQLEFVKNIDRGVYKIANEDKKRK